MIGPEIWIALGGLFLHAVALTGTGIWQLSKVKTDLLAALTEHRLDVHRIVDEDRKDIQDSLAALQQRISEVETESLKTFVRRDSFHQIMERVSAENNAFKAMIEARFDRQDAKMDRLIERMAAAAIKG